MKILLELPENPQDNFLYTQEDVCYDNEDIIAEYDSFGNLIDSYIHGQGIDEPLSMSRSSNTYYYTFDGLGSVSELTDASQNIVETYKYASFGNLSIYDSSGVFRPASIVNNSYTYTSREYDSETGLYFYRARYYDASVGRFITADPIGFESGDANFYSYVLSNPINLNDPFGFVPAPSGPPPFDVPGGGPDNGWKWNPNPNNPERGGGRWGPQRPIPGQSQPSTSWDPEGHWDVDDGKGNRYRNDRYGKPLTPDEAHGRTGNSKPKAPWWQRLPSRIPGPLPIIINPCIIDPLLPFCECNIEN